MSAPNGPERFGWVSRFLHWAMAILIIAMLVFGTILARMEVSLTNFWLFSLHKTIGVTLLLLALLRLGWHLVSPPPPSLSAGIAPWKLTLARWSHRALYVLMLAIPLTGWIASGASGLDVVVFGKITLPPLASVSEAWEKGFFAAHSVLTKLLMAVLALHVAGALHRHFVGRDRTLRRMLTG